MTLFAKWSAPNCFPALVVFAALCLSAVFPTVVRAQPHVYMSGTIGLHRRMFKVPSLRNLSSAADVEAGYGTLARTRFRGGTRAGASARMPRRTRISSSVRKQSRVFRPETR